MHKLGLDRIDPVRAGGVELPPPRRGQRVVEKEHGAQAVVWQTAVNPIAALELIESGACSGAGVPGPEAFDAVPFLDLLSGEYDSQ